MGDRFDESAPGRHPLDPEDAERFRQARTGGAPAVTATPPSPELALTVWPPGATARLGDLDVTILGVMLRKGEVLYEVAWINNGDRKESWVHGFELRAGSEEQRVGFRPETGRIG